MGPDNVQAPNQNQITDQNVVPAQSAPAVINSADSVMQPQAAIVNPNPEPVSAISIPPAPSAPVQSQQSSTLISNPQFTALNDTSHYDQQTVSKSGTYSLVSGIAIAIVAFSLQYFPFITHASSNMPVYFVYGGVAAAALLAMLYISVPSFKKNPYPNIAGLVGLIINIVILINMINALILFMTSGT